jgi:hypothetical protein
MSWLPLLLIVWVVVDVVIVAFVSHLARRPTPQVARSGPRRSTRLPQVSARPSSRAVH